MGYVERLPRGWTDLKDEDLKPPKYYLIKDERDNAAVFKKVSDGVFEGHFLFLDKGKEGITAGKKILNDVFAFAEVVLGKVPKEFRASKLMARYLGFSSYGLIGDDELFILTKKEFMNG